MARLGHRPLHRVDNARSIALTSPAGGHVLVGFGGLHAFGNAITLTTPAAAYPSGGDKATARAVTSTGTAGQILDGQGGSYVVS